MIRHNYRLRSIENFDLNIERFEGVIIRSQNLPSQKKLAGREDCPNLLAVIMFMFQFQCALTAMRLGYDGMSCLFFEYGLSEISAI